MTDFTTIGTSGLPRSGGFVEAEWHPRLRGERARRVYTEMKDNDAIVGTILYAIESLVRQVEWRAEPADGSSAALEAAEFLESCMRDMSHSWEDFLCEVLTMLPYGWSYFEVTYKKRGGPKRSPRSEHDDGLVGWRKIALRGQNTLHKWEFDDEGGIRGMWQIDPNAHGPTVLIPIEKALLFRTKAEQNNPEGWSILRRAYRSWYFLKRIQEHEAVGVERDLAGLPVARVPPKIMQSNASPAEKALRAQLETLVSQVRRDEHGGLVIPNSVDDKGNPTGYDFGLLASGGRRSIDTDKIIKRYENRIATSALADFILLGSDKVGSFALADTKTDIFAIALGAMLRNIKSTINKFAVARLFERNPKWSRELWPTVEHSDIETPDLNELSTFVKNTIGVKALTPDRGLEDKLRELANLPVLEDDSDRRALEEVRPMREDEAEDAVFEEQDADRRPPE